MGQVQRVVVHRLQRRVLAGQPSLLLPADVTDHASRFLFTCEALSSTEKITLSLYLSGFLRSAACRPTFAATTAALRSAHALSSEQASVWWLRLGIGINASNPAHPQQNGRHERMHLTLEKRSYQPGRREFPAKPGGRFDRFIDVFNNERPHEALDMQCPVESTNLLLVLTPDCRTSTILARQDHRGHALRPHLPGQEKNHFQPGLCRTSRGIKKSTTTSGWSALWIMIWGTYDLETRGSNRSKIPSAQKCYPCLRYVLSPMCPGRTHWILVGLGGLEPPTSPYQGRARSSVDRSKRRPSRRSGLQSP